MYAWAEYFFTNSRTALSLSKCVQIAVNSLYNASLASSQVLHEMENILNFTIGQTLCINDRIAGCFEAMVSQRLKTPSPELSDSIKQCEEYVVKNIPLNIRENIYNDIYYLLIKGYKTHLPDYQHSQSIIANVLKPLLDLNSATDLSEVQKTILNDNINNSDVLDEVKIKLLFSLCLGIKPLVKDCIDLLEITAMLRTPIKLHGWQSPSSRSSVMLKECEQIINYCLLSYNLEDQKLLSQEVQKISLAYHNAFCIAPNSKFILSLRESLENTLKSIQGLTEVLNYANLSSTLPQAQKVIKITKI